MGQISCFWLGIFVQHLEIQDLMALADIAASRRVASGNLSTRAFGIRFSLTYALMMIGSGIQLPFLPLWLSAQGLSVSEVATVVASMTAVRVVGAPLFATLADATGRRFLVIRGCAMAALVAYATLSQMQAYPFILGFGLLAAGLWAPVFPLIEGYSVDTSSRVGLDYGRMRLWASLSFLFGALVSGALLTRVPASHTMLLIAAGQAITFCATFILPPEPKHLPHPPQVSVDVVGGALRFLFASRFTVFLVAASLANASHGVLYGISTLHWTGLGFSTFEVGALWASGILAEVVLFFFSGPLVKRFGVARLLCFGLGGGAVRWLGMAFATNLYLIGFLQAMHCVSFVMGHLALMHFIRLNVPLNLRNTAQGLYTAFASGLLLSSVTWASGPLYLRFGGLAFLFPACLAVLGLGVALFYLKRLNPTAPRVVVASDLLNS
jgi:PPP family 3-phenylpropionic acid transporter